MKNYIIGTIGDYEINLQEFINLESSHPQSIDTIEEFIDSKLTVEQKLLLTAGTVEVAQINYRKKFINSLYHFLSSHCSAHASYAGKKIEKIFGKELIELYEKALNEEIASKQYRFAVFLNSLLVSNIQINKRIIMWVGGPSASGKTSSAKAVYHNLEDLLEATNPMSFNATAIIVDGAVLRETSQMRKAIIQAAIKLGYSYIKNLTKLDKFTTSTNRKLKKMLSALAFAENSKLNIIIPETFADVAFHSKLYKYKKKIIALNKQSNVLLVNASVVQGSTDAEFKKTVAFLGQRRSTLSNLKLLQSVEEKHVIELNKKELIESKKYKKVGFQRGKSQSQKAAAAMKKMGIVIQILNDLILIQHDGEEILVHKDHYNDWKKDNKELSWENFKEIDKKLGFKFIFSPSKDLIKAKHNPLLLEEPKEESKEYASFVSEEEKFNSSDGSDSSDGSENLSCYSDNNSKEATLSMLKESDTSSLLRASQRSRSKDQIKNFSLMSSSLFSQQNAKHQRMDLEDLSQNYHLPTKQVNSRTVNSLIARSLPTNRKKNQGLQPKEINTSAKKAPNIYRNADFKINFVHDELKKGLIEFNVSEDNLKDHRAISTSLNKSSESKIDELEGELIEREPEGHRKHYASQSVYKITSKHSIKTDLEGQKIQQLVCKKF